MSADLRLSLFASSCLVHDMPKREVGGWVLVAVLRKVK
jgi:hypothetical protein